MTNQIQKNIRTDFRLHTFLVISFLPSFGQKAKPETIQDYFKLIPDEYFSVFCCGEKRDAFIKKYVTVNDSQNGFMQGADLEEDPQYQGFTLKVFPLQTADGFWDYIHTAFTGRIIIFSNTKTEN